MKTIVRNLLSTLINKFYISIDSTEEPEVELKLFFITDQGNDSFDYLKSLINFNHTLEDLNLEYEKKQQKKFNNIYTVKIEDEIIKFNLDFRKNLDHSKMRTHY